VQNLGTNNKLNGCQKVAGSDAKASKVSQQPGFLKKMPWSN
jgi:hypothetical protein